jgi:hypothetical protein
MAALTTDDCVSSGQGEAGSHVDGPSIYQLETGFIMATLAIITEFPLMHIDMTRRTGVSRRFGLIKPQVKVAALTGYNLMLANQRETGNLMIEVHLFLNRLPGIRTVAR